MVKTRFLRLILVSGMALFPTLTYAENPFEKAARMEAEKRAIEGPTKEETVEWLNKNKYEITVIAGNTGDFRLYEGDRYDSLKAKLTFGSCSIEVEVEDQYWSYRDDAYYKEVYTHISFGQIEPKKPDHSVITFDCDTYEYGECAYTRYKVFDDSKRDPDWDLKTEYNDYMKIPSEHYTGRVYFQFKTTKYTQKYLDAFEHMKKLCTRKKKKDLF